MDLTLAELNAAGAGLLPGHLGVEVDTVEDGRVVARMDVTDHHLAPNGYLHASLHTARAALAVPGGWPTAAEQPVATV